MGESIRPITSPALSKTRSDRRRRGLHWGELSLLLLFGDLGVTGLSLAIAIGVWVLLPAPFVPVPQFPYWIAATLVAWPLALNLFDGYRILSAAFWRSSASSVAQAFTVVFIGTLVVFFVAPFAFPRGVALLSPMVTAAGLIAWRAIYVRMATSPRLTRRVLFLGFDESTRRLVDLFAGARGALAYSAAAIMAADGSPASFRRIAVVPIEDPIWRYVQDERIDEVVIAPASALPDETVKSLTDAYVHGVAITDGGRLYEALTGRVLVAALGTHWYADLPSLPHRPYYFVKRALDLLIVLAVAPIAIPLGFAVAVAVAITSGRPILFRQVRVGKRGRSFVIHKFRSMTREAEAGGPVFAAPHDVRRTRIGGLLRRTRLDELPQLWDVLRGEMSIIGPRPERPEFVEELARAVPLYTARHLVPPGITGWAQVRFPYADSLKDNLAKLEYDLFYVKHSGLLLDLNILVRTIAIVVRGRGR